MSAEAPKPAQAVFDEAAQAASLGHLKEAVEALRPLTEKRRITSTGVEEVLGRALVESGEVGHGILHLENAVALARFDRRARSDLSVAQARVEGGMGLPMSHPAEWGHEIATYLRPREAISLGSFCVILALGLRLFLSKSSRSLRYAPAALAIIFFALAIWAQSGKSLGVILSEVPLRSEPLESAQGGLSLHPGTRVRFLRQSGDFAEVERSGAFRGWVPASSFARGR